MSAARLAACVARLDELGADDFGAVHDRGFHWLHATLLPVIEEAALLLREVGRRSGPEVEACQLACYVVGDVHETNGAPHAGVAWYTRSLSLGRPIDAGAWREIGDCQLEMGEHDLARDSFEQALRLAPDDQVALSGLADLDAPEPPDPRYHQGDPCWDAAEALAIPDPARALELLAAPAAHAEAARQRCASWRACAHAAQDDRPAVLAELRALDDAGRPFHLEDRLWFFFGDELLRDPALWRTLAGLRLADGCVPSRLPRLPDPTPEDAPYVPRTSAELIDRQLRALGG